ncbi:carbohydrate sulfotransferase 9-like [Ptychodera flava]|uniref:carbohydrate sulfotransferase 9-like n=1 Tax=Ptychodera flava TaxID=63121 RepID=UPI00396A58F9
MACKRTHVYLLLLLCVTLPVSWIFSRLLVSGDVKNLYNAWKICNISLSPMDTRMIESRDRQNGLVVLPSHMKDKDKADINEKRKHVLQKLCHAIGRKNSGRGIILYNDQYKLLYCSVPKVACTSWRRVWLVLMGLEKSTNGIHHSVVHGKYGRFYPSLNKLNNREKVKRTESYLKFMFVRHPFARLLSAYRNKFEVFEQRTSRAFLPKYGPQIIPGYRFNSSLSMRLSGEKTGIQFKDFVRYVINTTDSAQFDGHWRPMDQLCSVCSINYDIIGKFENLAEDVQYVLRRASVDRLVSFPLTDTHVTNSSNIETLKRYYSTLSTEEIVKLYRLYENDFQLFGYPFPEEFLLWSYSS